VSGSLASTASVASRASRRPLTPHAGLGVHNLTKLSEDRLSQLLRLPHREGSAFENSVSEDVVEHIRDGHREAAWDVAQALARAVLGTKVAALAAAVLEGGPHALRRALELAEVMINAERDVRAGRTTATTE
jgi:predicted small metal-binding protein